MLDRVYMQFVTFMDDRMYRDEHEVNIELIRTLARVGPNAEPRFRDDREYSFFYFHLDFKLCTSTMQEACILRFRASSVILRIWGYTCV